MQSRHLQKRSTTYYIFGLYKERELYLNNFIVYAVTFRYFREHRFGFLQWYVSRRFLLISLSCSSVIAARRFLLFISLRCSSVMAARRALSLCLLRSFGSMMICVSELDSLWPSNVCNKKSQKGIVINSIYLHYKALIYIYKDQ